eukprot:gene3006-5966_t
MLGSRTGKWEFLDTSLLGRTGTPRQAAKKGGGTAMYIRKDISVTETYKEHGEDFELVACTLEGQVKHIAMYRRPGTEITEKAMAALEQQCSGKGATVATGDLNMNMNCRNPTPRTLNTFLNKGIGLTRHVKRNRRKQLLFDWEKADTEDIVSAIRAEMEEITQHFGNNVRNRVSKKKCREKATVAKEMEENGVGTHWELEDIVEAWDRAWRNIMQETVPDMQLKVSQGKQCRSKWITPEIKKLIKHRTHLEKMARENTEQWTQEMDTERKQAVKPIQKEILRAKRKHFQLERAELPAGKITGRKEGWKLFDRLSGKYRKDPGNP